MPRRLAVIALVVVLVATAMSAHAWADTPDDAVALLPLDADKNLEIYGQAVASEIARVLVAAGLDVVVVSSKMVVPERARVIVDGTIASKGVTVVLTLRMRNPADGTVLLAFQSTAASVATIDKAAADLAARVLPAVRDRIVALHRSIEQRGHVPERRPPMPTASRPMLVSVMAPKSEAVEPLRLALGAELEGWTHAHARAPITTEPKRLTKALAVNTVAASGTDLAIAFELLNYVTTQGEVPLARARVRVRIANASEILFDRVVVTDSVVGDLHGVVQKLATRTAREVLYILRPHLRRAVPSWR